MNHIEIPIVPIETSFPNGGAFQKFTTVIHGLVPIVNFASATGQPLLELALELKNLRIGSFIKGPAEPVLEILKESTRMLNHTVLPIGPPLTVPLVIFELTRVLFVPFFSINRKNLPLG
jgi:hypothetical protein